ncbi:MAG: TlyA family RNA methyltransferase [Sphaerochaetaceae bacterium]|nr:TlyA family RNA methyltransferase [Sphaerochaetaceae bacterium]
MAKLSVIQLLRQQNPQMTKDQASALVSCRNVYVNGELCTDPKQTFKGEATVEISFPKYVSRGGFKLEKALSEFGLDVKDLVMLDAGSSTGGFTDCLLQNGAKAVHSVDVGFNLLDYKIRNDSRVYVHEKQNIMTLERESLDPKPQAAVADLSFRSINGAASHVLDLVGHTWLVALIKPQFEVPKWQENFFGVIEDPELLRTTLVNVYETLDADGIGIYQATMSPIKGHKGNTEFLALLKDGHCMSCDEFLSACLRP